MTNPAEDECHACEAICIDGNLVLEEHRLAKAGDAAPLAERLAAAMPGDPVWQEVKKRLALVSDGTLSYFSEQACEVVTRVCINDRTGTVDGGKLFNQEQVPSETVFYSVLGGRREGTLEKLEAKLKAAENVLQVGGDATTGLGFCTVEVKVLP